MWISPRTRAFAPLIFIPIAIALGALAPGTLRDRFFDGLKRARPVRDIIAAVVLTSIGLATGFSMLEELASRFAPGLWLVGVMGCVGCVIVTGIWLICTRTIRPAPGTIRERTREWV